MTPLTHPAKKIDQMDSSQEKESSQVPRMIPLVHPAKIIDIVESKSKDVG